MQWWTIAPLCLAAAVVAQQCPDGKTPGTVNGQTVCCPGILSANDGGSACLVGCQLDKPSCFPFCNDGEGLTTSGVCTTVPITASDYTSLVYASASGSPAGNNNGAAGTAGSNGGTSASTPSAAASAASSPSAAAGTASSAPTAAGTVSSAPTMTTAAATGGSSVGGSSGGSTTTTGKSSSSKGGAAVITEAPGIVIAAFVAGAALL